MIEMMGIPPDSIMDMPYPDFNEFIKMKSELEEKKKTITQENIKNQIEEQKKQKIRRDIEERRLRSRALNGRRK